MFLVIIGFLLLGLAASGGLARRFVPELGEAPWLKYVQGFVAILGIWAIAATSYINVADNKVAVLKKIYGWSSLEGEHILAANGEKGIQAQIVPPGFHMWF